MMRTSFALLAVLSVVAALVAGCGEATSILVRVTSSTLTPPADVDTLEFSIRGETTGSVVDRTFPLTAGWPHSLSIRPGPMEASRVTVTVRALRGGTLVAQAVRTESFVRGTDIILDIELGAVGMPDAGSPDAGPRDAGPDTGPPLSDAGVDAPVDAGSDAALAIDAGADGGRGDAGCMSAADCDDGVTCTVDTCVGGGCMHMPDDSLCADGTTCNPMSGCPPRSCTLASECDDGRYCNGPESCDMGTMTCMSGISPCEDGDDCTDDACDESTDRCRPTTRDFDRDGAGDAMCPAVGGVPATDCDDTRADVLPGAPDVCDGLDNDCSMGCDSRSTCCRGTTSTCTTSCGSTGERTCGIACGWSVCSPPVERCNGADDDCNGACDDGFTCCAGSTGSCTTTCGSMGTRTCTTSCAFGACTPPVEVCNGRDDDCDTSCDDGFACCAGVASPCTTSCGSTGTQACSSTCMPMGACVAPAETCNDRDDDCDAIVDEGFACRNGTTMGCTTTCGSAGTRSCAACTFGACTPPAEICFNSIDDDCDSMADEGCPACGACTGATTVSEPGGRYNVTTSGSTSTGTCGGSGAEARLSFTISSTSDVFISTHASLRDTVLYVRRCACTGGPEVGCNDNAAGVTSSDLQLSDLAPGTYNVFVDTNVAMSQSIAVDVYINPPVGPSDRCGEPFLINAGTTTLTGSTCGFGRDYDNATLAGPANCPLAAAGDSEDAVAYFIVPTARTVTFNGCGGSPYDQTLYIRSVCSDGGTTAQLACSDDNCGTPSGMCDATIASNTSVSLAAGLYYLFVDGYGDPGCGCGNFSIAITGL